MPPTPPSLDCPARRPISPHTIRRTSARDRKTASAIPARTSAEPDQFLGGPLLPRPDKTGKGMPRPARNFGAKEMHVVRHDDVSTDKPAVAFPGRLPFAPQNTQSGWRGQDGTTVAGAGGDEVDGLGQANPPQALQMNPVRHGDDCGLTRGESKTKSATSSPWPTDNHPPCRPPRRGG